jgi:hypothetical protein
VLVGISLIVVGCAVIAWSLLGDSYDDRLEDRSLERVGRVGWGDHPLPIRRSRRIAGVAAGIMLVLAGAAWLI